jgi:hypothetical protein
MRRHILAVIIASMLIGATTLVAQAQTPGQSGFRTITSSHGYQFQVPSDWQEQDSSVQIQTSGVIAKVDEIVLSPDKAQAIIPFAEDASAVAFTAADLPVAATAAFGPLERSSVGAGGTRLQLFQGPDSVTVPNADAAVVAASVFSDSQGIPHVYSILMAVQGKMLYGFVARVTEDFYTSDPSYTRIMNSLQLTPVGSRLVPAAGVRDSFCGTSVQSCDASARREGA